jgi:hypothetical protein
VQLGKDCLAVSLLDCGEGLEFERPSILLATPCPRCLFQGVRIHPLKNHTVSLQVGIGSLKIPSLTAEGEAVVGALDYLLDGEGDEEAQLFAVAGGEGVDGGEGVAGATGALEADFAADQRPV